MTPTLQETWQRFVGRRVVGFNAKARHALHEGLEGFLFLGGHAAMAYGAWMIYHPLGPILGGYFAVKIAFLMEPEK